jgi:hypothetical protein
MKDNKKVIKQQNDKKPAPPKSGCASGNCGDNIGQEACCPEPYEYQFKYNCKAVPGDFKVIRSENKKCKCCPAPYEYEYTVKVKCVPTECEKDCFTPSSTTMTSGSTSTSTSDTFPPSFETSSTSSSSSSSSDKKKKRGGRK